MQSSLYSDVDIFPDFNSHDPSIVASKAYQGISKAGLRLFRLFQQHSADGKVTPEAFTAPGRPPPCVV
jgi:hypothetical protein